MDQPPPAAVQQLPQQQPVTAMHRWPIAVQQLPPTPPQAHHPYHNRHHTPHPLPTLPYPQKVASPSPHPLHPPSRHSVGPPQVGGAAEKGKMLVYKSFKYRIVQFNILENCVEIQRFITKVVESSKYVMHIYKVYA